MKCVCPCRRLFFLTYGLTKQYNVNLVFNTTKMAKATNVGKSMVWKASRMVNA